MTISEAHRLFKLLLDKGDALNVPNFRSEEIDVILNQGYRRWVKQRYGSTNPKRISFEEDQKRREDLKNLIDEYTDIPVKRKDNANVPIHEITLQSDHWFTIYERAILNCPSCNETISLQTTGAIELDTTFQGTYVDVIPTTHLELNTILKDPFNRPEGDIEKKVLRLENNGKIELILPTSCSPIYYVYRYVRKPVTVSLSGNITFETSDHTHEEIVYEAVKMALEGIEAKRTQSFIPIIDNTKE